MGNREVRCPWQQQATAGCETCCLSPSKPSPSARAVAPGSSKPPSAEPAQERGPPSPLCTLEAAAGGADLSMDICVDDYRVGSVMMFDARTGRGLVGEFFSRSLGLGQDCDAGSDAGQLAVVPAPVAAEAKGASQDPWSKFYASDEITSAAAAKDMAGSVAQQLKHAT